jgi:predicted GIY-YIG superfamily endonuclease
MVSHAFAMELKNGDQWFYTYFLRSQTHPNRTYIGSTEKSPYVRIKEHNTGTSAYTSRHRPWMLVGFTAFPTLAQAQNFETYLKTSAGNRFAHRHIFTENA